VLNALLPAGQNVARAACSPRPASAARQLSQRTALLLAASNSFFPMRSTAAMWWPHAYARV